MGPSITAILPRFTGEWAALLQSDALLAACGEVGYSGWRDRVLPPVTPMPRFLWQILHGHTACSHLPHLSGWRCSAAAYGQARARLPRRVFALLLERFSRAVQPCLASESRWRGHRLWWVDGSACSMPESPGVTGGVRPVDGAAARVWRSYGTSLGAVPCRPWYPPDARHRASPHPRLGARAGGASERTRGRWTADGSGPLFVCPSGFLAPAGVHAVRRVWARQSVDCTPGQPLVRPGVRRTPAVKGLPRSRWLKTRGVHAQRVPWFKPTTRPSWLPREALAALPEA